MILPTTSFRSAVAMISRASLIVSDLVISMVKLEAGPVLEVLTSYLNLTDRVNELRAALAHLSSPDAPSDGPELGLVIAPQPASNGAETLHG